MTASVITIARTLGAYGEAIGGALAERLGYRYVDEEILVRAAERAGVRPADVAHVEAAQTLVDKLARALAVSGSAGFEGGAFFAASTPCPRLEDVVVDAVAEIAAEGSVVLTAHGAGRALRHRSDALRCLVTAPPDIRAARVEGGRRAVDAADRARRDFFRRFFRDEERPDDYDVVLNTERVSLVHALDTLTRLAHATA